MKAKFLLLETHFNSKVVGLDLRSKRPYENETGSRCGSCKNGSTFKYLTGFMEE